MTYSLNAITTLSKAQQAVFVCLGASVNAKSHAGASLFLGRVVRAGYLLSEVPDKDGEIPWSSRVGVGREGNILNT